MRKSGPEPHTVSRLIAFCPFKSPSSPPSVSPLIISLLPPHITARGPLLIAPLIKEYLEFIGLYLFTECACQESGVPLKFTVTRSFTRQQPISRHPDQTIRWARRTSIPPWVIVGVLPTRPPMTCSVSQGQSFREVQKSQRITRQREGVLT